MTIYLGLGSNMGDRQAMLEQAIVLLSETVGVLKACSSFIETTPWGFHSDNLFLNAVVCMETCLTPHRLLDKTQQIERRMGRQRKTDMQGYADRCIDIDILLYGNMVIQSSRLTVPHPLMLQRAFVTQPLLEIAPDIIHPFYCRPIAELAKELSK